MTVILGFVYKTTTKMFISDRERRQIDSFHLPSASKVKARSSPGVDRSTVLYIYVYCVV